MLPQRFGTILNAATPHRVTLIRAGRTTDGYGDTVLDYDHPSKIRENVRAYVQATATQQNLTTGLEEIVQQWRVFLPPIDVAAWDRLLWEDHVFTFDGAPQVLQRRGSSVGWVIRLNDEAVNPGAQGVH